MISLSDMHPSRRKMIPKFLSTVACECDPYNKNTQSTQFSLFQENFSCLANEQAFLALKPQLVEIDLGDEISMLKQGASLEVCVPVLSITDLANSFKYATAPAQFPKVIGINGFGAKTSGKEGNNFPNAEFILITDIVGNQYEILVNQDGSVELPQDGTGLFTIISSITFIYSAEQVCSGLGLANLESAGLRKNILYLLPPEEANETFFVKICTSHIDASHRRVVDSIRNVNITYRAATEKLTKQISLSKQSPQAPEILHIDMALLLLLPFVTQKAFTANITLESQAGVSYSISQDSHGWVQHPLHDNVFIKHFGMNQDTLAHVVRDLYSQYDLMKGHLQGDNFGLSQENGFNNFLLRSEAFGTFYDLVLHDLVNRKMEGSFLVERIDQDHLADLDWSHIPADPHDSIVLSQLHDELTHSDYHTLTQLFSSHPQLHEGVTVVAKGLSELPAISLDIIDTSHAIPLHEIFGAGAQVTSFTPGYESMQGPSHPAKGHDLDDFDKDHPTHTPDKHF